MSEFSPFLQYLAVRGVTHLLSGSNNDRSIPAVVTPVLPPTLQAIADSNPELMIKLKQLGPKLLNSALQRN
jgi:hypothetical protein